MNKQFEVMYVDEVEGVTDIRKVKGEDCLDVMVKYLDDDFDKKDVEKLMVSQNLVKKVWSFSFGDEEGTIVVREL